MGYSAINSDEIQVGKPVSQPLMQKVKDNFDYLYGKIGVLSSSGLQNPSFEIDSDSDGIPDNWSKDLYPGGSGSYETTDVKHGTKAYKFVHPGGSGNGGGYLTSDYILATDTKISFSFYLKNTNAGTKVKCEIRCYDKSQTYLSSITAYESTNNPTSWTKINCAATLPSNTRYIKIRLHGGVDDTDAAGTVYFDYVDLTIDTYQVGDNLEGSSDGIVLTNSSTYVKKKEILLPKGGIIRVKFDLKIGTEGCTAYGRIYRNGVAVGTERTNNTEIYITFSEDISGWSPLDLCQLYICHDSGPGIYTYAKNFRIYVLYPTHCVVNL